MLLIEFSSIKFTKLLKIKKKQPIVKKKLYFSLKTLLTSEFILKLIKEETNKKIIPKDNADGKRNRPI